MVSFLELVSIQYKIRREKIECEDFDNKCNKKINEHPSNSYDIQYIYGCA